MTRYRWQRDLPAGYKQAYFLGRPVSLEINWSRVRERSKKESSIWR